MSQTIQERQVFMGGARFSLLPDVNGGDLPIDTIPSVFNGTVFECKSIVPITVTNFTGGAKFQRIIIKGDGQTTIDNNATIKTSTGAPKLLTANLIYRFTNINEVWYEDA